MDLGHRLNWNLMTIQQEGPWEVEVEREDRFYPLGEVGGDRDVGLADNLQEEGVVHQEEGVDLHRVEGVVVEACLLARIHHQEEVVEAYLVGRDHQAEVGEEAAEACLVVRGHQEEAVEVDLAVHDHLEEVEEEGVDLHQVEGVEACLEARDHQEEEEEAEACLMARNHQEEAVHVAEHFLP